MKYAFRVPTLVVLLAVLFVSGFGQKVGTSSMQFLKVMPTARATAMGDAYVSIATGADAIYWNPAGLSSLHYDECSSTITSWIFDTKQIAVAYGMPIGTVGNFGVQFQYVDFGTIQETTPETVNLVLDADGNRYFNPGLNGRSFSPYAYLIGLSYGRSLTDKFSMGVGMKYAFESLYYNQIATTVNPVTGEVSQYKTYADVMLFDFGLLYNTGFRSVQIGASIQNFGPQVTFAVVAHPAPLAMRMGVSANLIGADALFLQNDQNRMTVAFDLFQPNDYEQQMHIGAEYSFEDMVALRVGYKVDYDTEGLTYGGGIKVAFEGYQLMFDYSFGKLSEYLTNVHRLSLGVQFQ